MMRLWLLWWEIRHRWLWFRIRRRLGPAERRAIEANMRWAVAANPEVPSLVIRQMIVDEVIKQKAAWQRFLGCVS